MIGIRILAYSTVTVCMFFSLREKKAKQQHGDHENLMNMVSIYFRQLESVL